MDMLEIWNQVLENLEGTVSPVGFNIHIKTAVPVCFENSTFTISVATSINKNLVEYRYKKYIESSLEKVTGAKISLAVLVGDANELKQEIESKIGGRVKIEEPPQKNRRTEEETGKIGCTTG